MKRPLFMAAVLVILIGLLAIHYWFNIDRSPDKTSNDNKDLAQTPGGQNKPAEFPISIKDDVGFNTAVITYDGNKFFPDTISINGEASNQSCLLKIVNKSSVSLIIRLSPHDPKDGWGFPYPAVPPGEEIIIDPRYRIPEIVFHNHEKPDEDFSVNLAKECVL